MLIFFFFNDTATTEIYTLSLHDALPISTRQPRWGARGAPPPLKKVDHENLSGGHRCDGRHPHEGAQEARRSEEHTSELQSRLHLVCRLLLEKKKKKNNNLRG